MDVALVMGCLPWGFHGDGTGCREDMGRHWIAGVSEEVGQVAHQRSHCGSLLRARCCPWGWTLLSVMYSVLLGTANALADNPVAVRKLPADDLLCYLDNDGQRRKITSVHEWPLRRKQILQAMQSVMGTLPTGNAKRCPLEVTVEEEVDCGSYVRQFLTYMSEPGCRVPAYLLIPRRVLDMPGCQVPAVLCLHGTDHHVGHGTVVGLGSRPNRQYAAELAERGYVTLAPSYPLLAKYQPDLATLGWESGTLKAIWDNMRGLDLLESLPYVRKNGFGAIGHSLGGHNAVFTAAFDERIVATVTSCGLDMFVDYYGGDETLWLPEKGWTQTRYMPKLRHYRGRLRDIPFDVQEVVAAVAPRRLLIIAPLRDHNFRADSVDRLVEIARPVYQLLQANSRLQVEHPDYDHDFPPQMRHRAYEFLDEALLAPAPNGPCDQP